MRFEIYEKLTIFGKRFYFRFVGGNNEKVTYGEAYNSRAARNHAIGLIKQFAATAEIVEVKK